MRTISRNTPLSHESASHECAYRALLDQMHDLAMLVSEAGAVLYANPAAERLIGTRFRPGERNLYDVLSPGDAERLRAAVGDTFESGATTSVEHQCRQSDGSARVLDAVIQHFVVPDLPPVALVVARDVTDRRAGDDRRLEVQTLETAAQVSGAVARDFGDLLHTLGRHIDVLAALSPATGRAETRAMRHTIDRAWVLVEQVQSFGRLDDLQHQTVDVHDTVARAVEHLERLAGPGVEVIHLLGATATQINMSRAGLEQLLAALVTRAREGMSGGRLTITTRDASDLPHEDDADVMAPAAGVLIEIADSGPALSVSMRSRLETGVNASDMELELRRVFGLVRRAGGRVSFEADDEAGTTVRVRLPVAGRAEDRQ